MKHHTVQRL